MLNFCELLRYPLTLKKFFLDSKNPHSQKIWTFSTKCAIISSIILCESMVIGMDIWEVLKRETPTRVDEINLALQNCIDTIENTRVLLQDKSNKYADRDNDDKAMEYILNKKSPKLGQRREYEQQTLQMFL